MQTGTLNRTDKKTILILTTIYLIVALLNLGIFTAPLTGWVPQSKNESFTVEFDRSVPIDRIMLFGGLGPQWGAFGTLQVEAWQDDAWMPYTTINMDSVFRWIVDTHAVTTTRLRVTALPLQAKDGETESGFWQAEYRELSFISGDARLTNLRVVAETASPGIEALIDEQDIVPDRPSYLNGTYFDEIYFVRTALEHLEHREIIYENTHPPLGKNLIALSIAVLGFHPFSWRILGTVFGALMLPLMYMLAKRIFKDSFWALFCTWMLTFDFMHFTQTRIATIDSYCIFFIMAMYYSMLVYIDAPSWERSLPRSWTPLLFSGIFFGLGASVKWIALYGAFGLAFLFFKSRFDESEDERALRARNALLPARQQIEIMERRKWWRTRVLYTCLACIGMFIIIPAVLYILSYVPILKDNGTPWFRQILDAQKSMFDYHRNVNSPHPYYSYWYEWPFDIRPIFYYSGTLLFNGAAESIACFGNPLVWWSGVLGFLFVLILMLRRSGQIIRGWAGARPAKSGPVDRLIWFPFVGFLSQYLPWVIAPRKLTFIYHYFSCVPFVILMTGLLFRFLEQHGIIKRKTTLIFMGLAAILFVAFYPVISGLTVPRFQLNALQILPRWQW